MLQSRSAQASNLNNYAMSIQQKPLKQIKRQNTCRLTPGSYHYPSQEQIYALLRDLA